MKKRFCSLWRQWQNSSIRIKMTVLLMLASLLPSIIFSVFVYDYSHQLIARKERLAIESTLQVVSTAVRTTVADMESVILEVLSMPVVADILENPAYAPSAQWVYQTQQVEDVLDAVTITGRQQYGISVLSSSGAVYSNGNKRNLYERLDGELAGRFLGHQWQPITFQRKNIWEQTVITMGKAIREEDTLLGVILVEVPAQQFDQFFPTELAEQVSAFAFYEGNELFYSLENDLSADQVIAHLEEIRRSDGQICTIDGDKYLCAVSAKPNSETLVMLIPTRHVFADSRLYILYSLLLGIAAIFQMLLYARIISHLFTRRIQNMALQVAKFPQEMKPLPHPSGAMDEIGDLGEGFAQMSQQIVTLVNQLVKNEQQKRQLELAALRSQFDPHMLYNTLNTISYLARLQGISNIQEVSEAFSRLMRSLSRNTDEFIPLSQELSYLRDFVTVKKYNMIGDLTLTIRSDPQLDNQPVIKLLLQPFVENAITHGFANLARSCRLEIQITRQASGIRVQIADNGRGISADRLAALRSEIECPGSSKRIGIANTVRRFQLIYGAAAKFQIESEEGRFTAVTLFWPDDGKGDPHAEDSAG